MAKILDTGNSINNGMLLRFFFPDGSGDSITDLSSVGDIGNLVDLTPGVSGWVVSGTSGYNGTYTANGTVNGYPAFRLDSAHYLEYMWNGCYGLGSYSGFAPYEAAYTCDGAALPGTWSGATLTAGDPLEGPWFSDGLDINGTGAVAVANDRLDLGTSDWSMMFDITPGASGSGYRTMFAKQSSANGYSGSAFARASSTTAFLDLSDANGRHYWESIACSQDITPDNTRVTIVLTADRDGNFIIYRDGTQIGSQDISSAASASVSSVGTAMRVFANRTGQSNNFLGRAHSFALANRVWSAAEVASFSAGGDVGLVAASSGQSVSLTDALAVTEALSVSHAGAVALSDAAVVSEALGVAQAHRAALTDAATIGEALAAGIASDTDVADAAAISEALEISQAHLQDVAEGLAVTETLQVLAHRAQAVTDALAIGETLRVTHGGGVIALGDTAGLSDICEMRADGSVWVGQYEAAGTTALPLLRVAGYSTAHAGTVGARELRRLTGVTIEEPVETAAVRGVLSLHPDGWALVLVDATHLQLWQYAAGVWVVVAEAVMDAAYDSGTAPASEAISYGGVSTRTVQRPGDLRLEVVGGDVYALAFGSGCTSYVLRGAALVPVVPPGDPAYVPGSLPALVAATWGINGGQADDETTAYPAAAVWRGRWYVGGTSGGHDVQRSDDSGWWFDLPDVAPFGVAIFTDVARLCAVKLYWSSFALTGAGLTALPATAQAGLWACYDGQRLWRSIVDCLPLAGRDTGGTMWLLGTDAAGIYPQAKGGGGIGGGLEGWPVPSALYRVGVAAPAEGVVIVGCDDETLNGWYEHQEGIAVNGRDVWVSEDGEHWVVWDGEHWIIVDAPPAVVSGTGTEADGTYNYVDGHWEQDGGAHEIVWQDGHWVIVDGDGTVLYQDGSGDTPFGGTWTVVGGTGAAPTVTVGTIGEALETDGTGTAPWTWPADEVTPPVEGEQVVWYSQSDAGRPATAVRVDAGVALAAEGQFRAVVGVAEPGAVVDWTQYVAAPWGGRVLLPEAATTVWVGIIGPATVNVPAVTAVLLRN